MLKLSLTISTAILVVILGSVDGQEQQESTNCGDGRCLHGATCLEKTGTDGDSHFHCDCSTANTPEISYAGQWCQYQVTTFCTSINSNPRLFCVNNGVCKEDVYEGCDCPSGFSGFSCEYQVQVPVDFSPPATSSTNGQTVVGDPDHTGHKPQSDSPQEDASIYDEKDTTYVEQDTIIYERPATMICTEGDLGPAKPLSFCLNFGTCKAKVSPDDSHPGCMCTDQWEGQHCEQKKMATAITTSEVSSEATETSARERKASTTKVNTLEAGLLAGSLVLLVAIILCALSMFYRYKQRAKMAESAAAFLGAERNYKDESNISPYRDSAADPIPNMHYTSSSDPYSTMIVDGETTRQVSRIANPRLLVAFEGDEHDQLRPVEIC